jgi:hypothetical protein
MSAEKATYGRFNEDGDTDGYSKDYLQVSGANRDLMVALLPPDPGSTKHELRLRSPGGVDEYGFVEHSADRYHLAWAISSPPAAWKKTPQPTKDGPGTIPGDPSATTIAAANASCAAFAATGIKAYLVAVKLGGDTSSLHLRAYLADEPSNLQFADVTRLPEPIRDLLGSFRTNHACVSLRFGPDHDVYFDPKRNHDAWLDSVPTSDTASEDLVAEALEADESEVDRLKSQMEVGGFAVPDRVVATKTRGSAQRAFADRVKANYNWRCAITGIATREFLVASHVVPWSEDESIRLDPQNGICLSTLVDRAFDTGHLLIHEDCTVRIDWLRVGADPALRQALSPYDGLALTLPLASPPNPEFLRRRLGKA